MLKKNMHVQCSGKADTCIFYKTKIKWANLRALLMEA